MMRVSTRTVACLVCTAAVLLSVHVLAGEAVFLANLAASGESPPSPSGAVGIAAATLNPDGSLSYSVTTAGFETKFLSAHVREGSPGKVGPVLFGVLCNADGTSCSGRSPLLGLAQRSLIVAGNTYLSFSTDAYPDGEIRGQLAPSSLVSGTEESGIDKLSGKASRVGTASVLGSSRRADILISGRFGVPGGLDLSVSNAVIESLLAEVDESGELVRGNAGEPVLPVPLRLVRYKARRRQVTYKTIGAGLHPLCRLKMKPRGPQVLQFSLRCTGAGGPTIPQFPRECSGGSDPTTELMTSFIVNAGTPLRVRALQPWRCLGTRVRSGATGTIDGDQRSQAKTRASARTEGNNRAPVADFTAAPRTGDPPLNVVFSNRSLDPDGEVAAYSWDFGDGGVSAEESPIHTYTSPGQFVASLVVTDDEGMTSKPKRETISVKSNREPRSDFDVTPRRGDAPLTVDFADSSSDPDGEIVGRTWNFGDGGFSIEDNPTHTYMSAGQFVVTLVVTDDRGMTSKPTRQTISVKGNRMPLADFLATPRRGHPPMTVNFTNRSSDPDGELVAFGWTFGDGGGSVEENPTHTYRREGEFVVTLMVTDNRGAASEMKRDTVSVKDPTETEGGADLEEADNDRVPIEVNRPARVGFRVNPNRGTWPLTVTFTNTSSDPDGDGMTFMWTFGDGGTSTQESPTHTYRNDGQFVVTLTVTDERGMVSPPKRDTVSVLPNRQPRADFRADRLRGGAPMIVRFTNGSSDTDGDPLTFRWSFGDGRVGTAENPTHTYARAGQFVVTLLATDDRGMTSEPKRETITVAVNRRPRADFRADPRRGDTPLTVTFTNRSSDPDGDEMTFRWSFDDGTISTEREPTYTFVNTGTFDVTLTVTDERGATSAQPKTEGIEVKHRFGGSRN